MALANRATHAQRRESRTGRPTPFPIVSTVLLVLTFIGMMISIGMIFFFVPRLHLATPVLRGSASRCSMAAISREGRQSLPSQCVPRRSLSTR